MLVISAGFSSCDDGLEEVNLNPNDPELVPTANIFASATKSYIDFSRNAFNSGRLTQNWVEYWGQTAYADEDRYLYRESSAESIYQNTYLVATDFKSIIVFFLFVFAFFFLCVCSFLADFILLVKLILANAN